MYKRLYEQNKIGKVIVNGQEVDIVNHAKASDAKKVLASFITQWWAS